MRSGLVVLLAAVIFSIFAHVASAGDGEPCAKNQTPGESLDVLKKSKSPKTETGTGLFVVPTPDVGVDAYRIVVVKNITYDEATARGQGTPAYKWIADAWKTPKDVDDGLKLVKCSDQFCLSGRCSSWQCHCVGSSNWCR